MDHPKDHSLFGLGLPGHPLEGPGIYIYIHPVEKATDGVGRFFLFFFVFRYHIVERRMRHLADSSGDPGGPRLSRGNPIWLGQKVDVEPKIGGKFPKMRENPYKNIKNG